MALDALRDDARRWDRAATTMRGAAHDAAALGPDPAAFSFAGQAAAQAYQALQTKVAALLGEGAANFTDIATALRTSADAYAAEDAAGVHRLRTIY